MATNSCIDPTPAGLRGPAAGRPGFGMLAVLLVMLLAGAVASAAGLLGVNSVLISAYALRESSMQATADDGLERARAQLNGNKTLYNDTAIVRIEHDAVVYDANGKAVPGLKRNTWVGPAGVATGQFGVFGNILVVVDDGKGDRVVRRGAVNQESFSKYAWFTDNEGNNIYFGGGDQIQGPVHSNDQIQIDVSRATFLGPVSTAKDISGRTYGTFKQGYKEHVQKIPMPPTADLQRLKGYGQSGGTYFKPQNDPPASGTARMRIEFVALDVNNSGRIEDNEAFIRVYDSQNEDWVTAHVPSSGIWNSQNCGHVETTGANKPHWVPVWKHPHNSPSPPNDSATKMLRRNDIRCYLGGDEAMFDGVFKPSTNGAEPFTNVVGSWRQWTDHPDSDLVAKVGATEAKYLIPISHARNPNFKGVIFADGKVGISGVVRGHITLASTSDIVLLDDITYAIDRGLGGCEDLLGLYSAHDIIMADNVFNAPQVTYNGQPTTYTSYDDTNAEFVNGVVLALHSFAAENYDQGSNSAQPCETKTWGRGCLYLTGGIIQGIRGAIGQANGTGYLKRYSYDQCAAIIPPPYFPTTGHFDRGQYFEVNPAVDPATYMNSLMARH